MTRNTTTQLQGDVRSMNYRKLMTQRRDLANAPELWQFDLLSPQNFFHFARDRGVPVVDAGTVMNLWHVGLLRADLISARRKLEIPFLELVSEDNGIFAYCDKRPVEHRKGGYGRAFSNAEPEADGIELQFHAFRLYVMYHIDRVFHSNTTSTQYLLNPDELISLARHEIEFLNRWTSSKEFVERFEHWNRIAEIAIVLEPTAYTAVFHTKRLQFPDTEESVEAKLSEWREKNRDFLSELGTNQINEIRAELCRDSEILDGNKLVHVVLRLTSSHQRLKLRDTLGACMHFLCMAEIIRRAAENALGQNLPEEDELGFGQWMAGARKSIYGSERVLDSTREARRDFLTSMGLDYGTKVRCYVEGETEFGALTSAVGDAGGTEFINLRGQVVEKRGKGLNFAASLKNDMRSHVFSVVVLDQDRDDYVRALKKAATDGAFFGRFFLSSPDFEFANFTVSELVDVLLNLVGRDRDTVPTKSEIVSLVAEARSGKQFFEALKKYGLQDIEKNETWGKALMNYALQRTTLPLDHKKAGETRPVLEVARLLVHARGAGYVRSLEALKVDPESGELRDK